ncbi:MAG: hypothetical protein ABIK89_13210 [Planctomycetota bacterium]
MAERGVEYRLLVRADKGNASVLKAFEAQLTRPYTAMVKAAQQAQASILKTTKAAGDGQVKDTRRVGQEKDRILKRGKASDKRAADARLKESNRVLNRILRDMNREAAEKERADARIIRSQQRVRRLVEREHEAMARSGQKVWEKTRTPLEMYNLRVARLKVLLDQNKISQETYNRAVLQSQAALNAAGAAGITAFGPQALRMISTFASGLGIVGGVAGAAMLVRREFEGIIEAQRRAKQASLTTADAQIQALRNLGATSAGEREDFIARVGKSSKETGASEKDLYIALSFALSARGNLPKSAAFEAVKQAALFAPEDLGAMETAAGAALDVQKMQPGISATAGLGFLMAVQARARIVDPKLMAENAPPALGAAVARGATLKESGALYATLTQRMFEHTGRRSATAQISFAERLENMDDLVKKEELIAAKKATREGPLSEEDQERVAMMAGLSAADRATIVGRDFSAKVRLLQQNAGLKAAFMKQPFEKKAQESIESLLTAGSSTAEMFEQFKREIPGAEEAAPLFLTRLGVQRGSDLQKMAQFSRMVKSSKERLEMLDEPGARMSIIYDEFKDVLQSAGMGSTKAQFTKLIGRRGGLEGFAEGLETKRRELLAPYDLQGGRQLVRVPRTVTPLESQQAAELGELIQILWAADSGVIDKLGEVVDAIKEQTITTEDFTAALVNRLLPAALQRSAAPPARDVQPRSPGVRTPRGSR